MIRLRPLNRGFANFGLNYLQIVDEERKDKCIRINRRIEMVATIGIDIAGEVKEFVLQGNIGYAPLSAMVSAPTGSGGGMRVLDVLKVWEGDETFLIPFGHLIYFRLSRGEEK
jgi:hypothetical protein